MSGPFLGTKARRGSVFVRVLLWAAGIMATAVAGVLAEGWVGGAFSRNASGDSARQGLSGSTAGGDVIPDGREANGRGAGAGGGKVVSGGDDDVADGGAMRQASYRDRPRDVGGGARAVVGGGDGGGNATYFPVTGRQLAQWGDTYVGRKVCFTGRVTQTNARGGSGGSSVLISNDRHFEVLVDWADCPPDLQKHLRLLRKGRGGQFILRGTLTHVIGPSRGALRVDRWQDGG